MTTPSRPRRWRPCWKKKRCGSRRRFAPSVSRLQWASDLLPWLAEAAERRRQWEETGLPIQGLPTGIARLDDLLNGLNEGFHLLGGPRDGENDPCLATRDSCRP